MDNHDLTSGHQRPPIEANNTSPRPTRPDPTDQPDGRPRALRATTFLRERHPDNAAGSARNYPFGTNHLDCGEHRAEERDEG